MMNIYITNTVDFLAYNLNYELPCLSAEDVKLALDFEISYWYKSYNQAVTDSFYELPSVTDYHYTPIYYQTDFQTKIKSSPRSRTNSSTSLDFQMDFDQFRTELKNHRLRLGLTQTDAAKSITKITNRKISQTSLCRFENNQLHTKNMKNLVPYFRNWVGKTSTD